MGRRIVAAALALAVVGCGQSGGVVGLDVSRATVARGGTVEVRLRNGTHGDVPIDLGVSLYEVGPGGEREVPALGPGESWPPVRVTLRPGGVSEPVTVTTRRLAPGTYRVAKTVRYGGGPHVASATFVVT
jgi:hypothetical protein